ncbi:MAG: type II secretion system protein K [Lysobacteraceae bacterium]|nr:MAG: type II secretion system protein K [Xanthomonadaceae bacterium]
MRDKQQGVALILVLWVSILLTVIVGSFSIVARTETIQARHLLDTTRARYAAEAGLHRAAYEMRNPKEEGKWIADGRPYTFKFEEIEVEVMVVDESGKIDINSAQQPTLAALFTSAGIEDQGMIDELVDAVIDFRDPDDLVSLHGAEAEAYEAAGYPYGPKNGPFESVPEFQQVIGMNWELYQKLEPAITVYSGRSGVNPAFAPRSALLTIDGMTIDIVDQFISDRNNSQPGDPPLTLPDGTPVVARGGGLTYSVRARATLPNGASSELKATIRLGNGLTGRPFRIVRWRDGSIT